MPAPRSVVSCSRVNCSCLRSANAAASMSAKIRSNSAGFAASSRVMRVKLRVWCTSVTSMPKARKGPGARGKEDGADAEVADDAAGDGRAHAAERHQGELARIVAALDGDGAHRHGD